MLHGIGNILWMIRVLEKRLSKSGFNTRIIKYPSMNSDLSTCAEYLHEQLRDYPAKSIHFVTHSMGALVVRKYIEKYGEDQIIRIVMMGPPNQGSIVAKRMKYLISPFYGPAFLEMGDKSKIQSLPVPKTDFMIISGYSRFKYGWNPIIQDNNDFLVGVQETYLPGAKEYKLVNHYHAYIPTGKDTLEYIKDFLNDHNQPSH